MHIKTYQNFIASLKYKNICRGLPSLGTPNNQPLYLNFSSNDYLQLSKSSLILKSGILCAKQYGLGSTGSRLLSGNHELFERFEKEIAQSKNTEKALLFNSGFQANLTVLSALLDSKHFNKQPLVFFDKLNHKSLYEGVSLSGAKLIRYKHNDLRHLDFLLNKYLPLDNPKFIIAETVYGMDGDRLDIKKIVELASQHKALLYLDEAHATGLFGSQGYGLSTEVDFKAVVHVIMGTFSKALGGSGAYIACSEIIYQYLMNRCSGFIYSTASSPMIVGAMQKAWNLVPSYQPQVLKMFELAKHFRNKLKQLKYDTGASSTHIIPIIYSEPNKGLELKQKLADNNILVSFIQYPTVPKNQPRLRVALNIHHNKQDIDRLLSFL